jgi:hypothetical protein
MTGTCATCRFYRGDYDTSAGGECRRNPPHNSGDPFPKIMAVDWCGEFVKDTQPAPAVNRIHVRSQDADGTLYEDGQKIGWSCHRCGAAHLQRKEPDQRS